MCVLVVTLSFTTHLHTCTHIINIATNNRFPEGEWQSYKDDNVWRETSAEKRDLERLSADMINDVRQAAEVHRQVMRVRNSSKE